MSARRLRHYAVRAFDSRSRRLHHAARTPAHQRPRALKMAAHQVPPADITLDIRADWRETLTAIGAVLTALAIAAGLYLTNAANRQTAENANRQQQLAEQGQTTDRFTTAIEQLAQKGDDNLSIRLGAIYALRRIMAQSAEDESAAIDVLSTYVRTHTGPIRTQRGSDDSPRASGDSPQSAPDIRAAFLAVAYRPRPANNPVNLTGSYLVLRGENLGGADLAGFDLRQGDFSGTHFVRANLSHADFSGANLSEANFIDSELSGTLLRQAVAHLARFSGRVVDADFSYAYLQNASFAGATLSRDLFEGANLQQADLRGADLREVWFSNPSGWGPAVSDEYRSGLWKGAVTDGRTLWPDAVTVHTSDSGRITGLTFRG